MLKFSREKYVRQLDNTLKEFAITLLIEQRMELWKV
jgi:hypothetical protein